MELLDLLRKQVWLMAVVRTYTTRLVRQKSPVAIAMMEDVPDLPRLGQTIDFAWRKLVLSNSLFASIKLIRSTLLGNVPFPVEQSLMATPALVMTLAGLGFWINHALSSLESWDELRDVPVAADAAEAALGVEECGADPSVDTPDAVASIVCSSGASRDAAHSTDSSRTSPSALRTRRR